ncbi:hypothetical protein Dcar01_03699 [Deinococcus carri]|uniref:MarR family transcriptional regulator n=1 Tax=Deinococcus carri TaxID=1211323 RepID=A0ABP9WC87_9DEIO
MTETLKDRVLRLLTLHPGLSDRQLADGLMGAGASQQDVNQACRQLHARGRIVRLKGEGGRIRSYVAEASPQVPVAPLLPSAQQAPANLSEDVLKVALVRWLEKAGWELTFCAPGRAHGIDIEAHRGAERWVIEVKGIGSRDPMRVNYFLAVLGETLQRMNDPRARYSIALPEHRQFVRLWDRLPDLAKERTGISALFVNEAGEVREA